MKNSVITFQADDEWTCDASRKEPALLVNPKATTGALIDAARARMLRIERIVAPYVSFDLSTLGAMNPGELVDLIMVLQTLNNEARLLTELALERSGALSSIAVVGATC